MTIDWTAFTPYSSFMGGMLIGLAAGMLVLLNGRIAGISGVLGGLMKPIKGDVSWRIAFISGLVIAPFGYAFFALVPRPHIDAGWTAVISAGLLVGLGTRLASGCTSGHGVCGLSRLSGRSLAATLAFMGTGFVTVFLIRHFL